MKEELRQAGDIVAGKPFLPRRRFTDPKYAQLGQLWGPEDPYMDLAASAADAVVHFRSQKDHKTEELFWSQFHSPDRSLPLTDRLAEWAELNRLSGVAMTDIVTHVWLVAAISWGGAAYQGDEAVGLHRGCADGPCPCEDTLDRDGCHRYCRPGFGRKPVTRRALFWGSYAWRSCNRVAVLKKMSRSNERFSL